MTKRTLTVIESREENSPIVEDFAAAAQQKKWNFRRLEKINSDNISRFDFKDIPLNFVIYRALNNNYHEIERLIQWLNHNQKITINCNVHGSYASCSDKYFQQGLFMLDTLLVPHVLPTYEAKNKSNVLSYIHNHRVHLPIILKERNGSTGKNITLIREESDLNQIADFSNLIIEQYVEPECDYRVFTIGGVAIGVIRKYGDPDHPENLQVWSAGRRKYLEANAADLDILSEIATRTATASRSELSGIDIVREKGTNKFYVLENNIAAGWLNLTQQTMVDVPSAVIDWMSLIADGRELLAASTSPASHAAAFATTLQAYLDHYNKYLPQRLQKTCASILNGTPGAADPYQKIFATYPDTYLTDAGYLFTHLHSAYQDIAIHPDLTTLPQSRLAEISTFLTTIENLPFSWAGNFIGPEVGTFHDGAILSALYLYLHRQLSQNTSSQIPQNML